MIAGDEDTDKAFGNRPLETEIFCQTPDLICNDLRLQMPAR